MARFKSSDIVRFANQGEVEISIERPFLVDRYSPAVQAGNAVITIPDYVRSIKRMTWFGWAMDPLPGRNQREVFQGIASVGRPFWYVYNEVSSNTLKLFPNPDVTLNAVAGDLWAANQIQQGLVIEFYRPSDNSTFVLPPYKKRQMLKAYVSKRAYQVDGPGMNMKLAQYYTQKWEVAKQNFVSLLDDLYTMPRKLMVDQVTNSNFYPGTPILPIDRYGISVDEGE